MTSNITGQQWIKTTDRATGRQLAVAVPSATTPGLYHLVSRKGCTCKGFEHRGRCRHHDSVMAELTSQAAAERFAGRAAPVYDGPRVPLIPGRLSA